jgi:hypothetical protein
MMLMTYAPVELYDEVVVGSASTGDGEMLAHLDEVPAGAWLAVVLESVDRSKLTALDLLAYQRQCARLQAWLAAQQMAAVAQLATCPHDDVAPDVEVGFALREPRGAAQRRVWQSRRVIRRLPRWWQAMADGELSERHVSKLVDATATVEDPDLLARVEERVLANIGVKTPDELARYAKDTLKRLDPEGVGRRARKAREQADVSLHPGEDGTGDVVIHGPIEDAVLVKTGVDAYAAAAKQCGDDRPIGVIRAEAPAVWASNYLRGLADGHVPRSAGRPIEIGITLPLRSALGLDPLPGEVPGLGVVPREVIAKLIRDELPKLRLLVIDPDSGRLLHRAESAYRPTPEQVAQVRATYVFSVGPGSQILATRCDIDHAVAHPVGPTQIGNLIPFDRPNHVHKTRGSLSVTVGDSATVYLTSRLGQTRTVTAYDYRMTDDEQGPATGAQ